VRIAIAKPDYGIVGGFELVVARIAAALQRAGHTVTWATVDVTALPRRPFGTSVPDDVWQQSPELFRYLALVEAFAALDVAEADVVVSTQPPSFAVDHPRQLAVFYHHLRVFYDLADVFVDAGMAGDLDLFHAARDRVRRVDERYLQRPAWFLTPSETVRGRLAAFNGIADTTGPYHAGVPLEHPPVPQDAYGFDQPVCVSRHEFPKRTELFVHAMKLLPDLTGAMVGIGGRLPFVQSLDARLSAMDTSAVADVDSRELWLCRHDGVEPVEAAPDSNVRFLGRVDDFELARLYAQALCVVAPAYQEDYGLTAIEAMQHGKPVVVCDDGGGLVELVDDGVTGLVVEPTGPAIAAAVESLRAEPERARALGEAARERSAEFTWDRADRQLFDGLERVLS